MIIICVKIFKFKYIRFMSNNHIISQIITLIQKYVFLNYNLKNKINED